MGRTYYAPERIARQRDSKECLRAGRTGGWVGIQSRNLWWPKGVPEDGFICSNVEASLSIAATVGTAIAIFSSTITMSAAGGHQTRAGNEITAAKAAAIALAQARRTEAVSCTSKGCYLGALKAVTAHGLFAQASAVCERQGPSAIQFNTGSQQVDKWQRSAVYLVVMTGNERFPIKFTLDTSHPRNMPGPSGGALSLIVDAHTGAVEARFLDPVERAPRASELGHVVVATAPREPLRALRRHPHGTSGRAVA